MYRFVHQHKCVVFMMTPPIQTLRLAGEWRCVGLCKVIPDLASGELLLICTGAQEPGRRSKDSRTEPKLTQVKHKKSVRLA